MKKSYRIKKNEEFESIINKKHYYANACFVIYADDKKEENARVGISVSKKLGDAVVRNKIKRQVRMMFLKTYDFNNEKYDLICIVRSKYKDNSYDENSKMLEKLIKKAIIRQ